MWALLVAAAAVAGSITPATDCSGTTPVEKWIGAIQAGGGEAHRIAAAGVRVPRKRCEVDALLRALSDRRAAVRVVALRALGEASRASPADARRISRCLRDDEASVREHATLTLARLGRASVPVLARLLTRIDDEAVPETRPPPEMERWGVAAGERRRIRVSDYATVAFHSLGCDAAPAVAGAVRRDDDDSLREAARGLFVKCGSGSLPVLADLCRTGDDGLRLWAAAAALEIRLEDGDACRTLTSLLSSQDSGISSKATEAAWGCPSLATEIVRRLGDPESTLDRSRAENAILEAYAQGTGVILATYSAALRQAPMALIKPYLLRNMVYAMEKRRGDPALEHAAPEIIPLLGRALRLGDREDRVSAALGVAALGERAFELLPELLPLISTEDDELSRRALSAVEAFGRCAYTSNEVLRRLAATAQEDLLGDVLKTIVKVTDPETARDVLRSRLGPATLESVAPAIGDLREEGVALLPDLTAALLASTSKDGEYAVVEATSRMGPAAEEAMRVLAATAPLASIRQAALYFLPARAGRRPGEPNAFVQALRDPDDEVRHAALQQLGPDLEPSEAAAIGDLIERETEDDVRSMAFRALRRSGAAAAAAAPAIRRWLAAAADPDEDDGAATLFVLSPTDRRPADLDRWLIRGDTSALEEGADAIWYELLPNLHRTDCGPCASAALGIVLRAHRIDERALVHVDQLLESKGEESRAAAFVILAKLGRASPEDHARLMKGLNDEEEVVRRAAGLALDALFPTHSDPRRDAIAADAFAESFVAQGLKEIVGSGATGAVTQEVTVAATVETFPMFELPPLPWSSYDTIDRQKLGTVGAPLSSVLARLRSALARLGYHENGIFQVAEDGFALLTRLERIDHRGNPYPDPDRWSRERLIPRSFGEYLRTLFLERPGRFRCFAFLVTARSPSSSPPTTTEEMIDAALDDARRGDLPESIGQIPFREQQCHALVYLLEKVPGGVGRLMKPDPIGWGTQLASLLRVLSEP